MVEPRLTPPWDVDTRVGREVRAFIGHTVFATVIQAGAIVAAAFPSPGMPVWRLYVLAGLGFVLALCAIAACYHRLGHRDGYQKAAYHAQLYDVQATALIHTALTAPATPCDLDIDLSPALPGEGYLYLIEYSTDVVKVGQTLDPRRRIGEHRRDGGAFNVVIVDFWISPPHQNYLENELALIGFGAGIGTRAKREYFHNANFDDLVDFANTLTYAPFHATAVGAAR